jgi:exodeoxyribonuclease V gamma subunit
MPSSLRPGLITLHGNQLEQLRDVVCDWLSQHPLGPLEEETFLVQSNGIAEWLKIALAEKGGVCASSRVTLPARFLWEAYRTQLGPGRVPRRSPFDKSPLTWRLMRLLPGLLNHPEFGPLRHFLADEDPERSLQLCQRLADLMDQYQVYRADWLEDWADGKPVLRLAQGGEKELTAAQRWQALLWAALMESVDESQRASGRAQVHRQFVQAIAEGQESARPLPRRVVLFGISALPYQTLEALGALSKTMQVVLAVPNPCRFYWGDIIDGRELLAAQRRRQPLRDGRDLSAVALEEMHAHSHPLLAAWGRLGRDFIRMLDQFDDAEATNQAFPQLRIDLFSEEAGDTLLAQVQAAIRDMLPLEEHPRLSLAAGDRSLEFHVAHNVQREVEILHDQLLQMFANDASLRPRDVVVMVPDIAAFAPAIEAVFGQHARHDERFIPYEVVDAAQRHGNPVLLALEWLLRLPQQRCLQSEVRDLLDVPALASRFSLQEADLPRLGQWIEESGVRWGLDKQHRQGIGLGPAGEQNAWIFGIRRMLLGYASGHDACFADIEPYPEVGGLDAALAGSLAGFVDALLEWRALLSKPVLPEEWAWRARSLLKAFFDLREEEDRLTGLQLEQALQCWLDDCALAGFRESVPLAVFREAWLDALDEPALHQRFMSGGVTFCTLMPMRAVPFRVVCLLGMNDGDYPRRAQRADFDLLALPGLARPGDRSRRDDDRYLMLEALLAARDKFYISWTGRNVRDNSEQPPSILVAQLRDYLQAGWEIDVARLTTEHPLQPFSRRYFEEGGLVTYAKEWRDAHASDTSKISEKPLPPWEPEPEFRLALSSLGQFMRQPARYFFRHRLQVDFYERRLVGQDEEAFGLNALDYHTYAAALLEDRGPQEAIAAVEQVLQQRTARLAREGVLPIGLMGTHWQKQLVSELVPVRKTWLRYCSRYPIASAKLPVSFAHSGIRLEDWLDKLRTDGREAVWLELQAGRLIQQDGKHLKGHKLFHSWLRQLAAAMLGHPVTGYIVATDNVIEVTPIAAEEAQKNLKRLIECWHEGMNRPLPVACKTSLVYLEAERAGKDAHKNAATIYEGDFNPRPEGGEVCLARLWPSYECLCSEPEWRRWMRELYGPYSDWLASGIRILPLSDAEDGMIDQGAA